MSMGGEAANLLETTPLVWADGGAACVGARVNDGGGAENPGNAVVVVVGVGCTRPCRPSRDAAAAAAAAVASSP